MYMTALERVDLEWNSPRYTNTTADEAQTLCTEQSIISSSILFWDLSSQFLCTQPLCVTDNPLQTVPFATNEFDFFAAVII